MSRTRAIAQVLLASGLVFPCFARAIGKPPAPQSETAQESWHKEFDELCSRTQDAMTLSEEQLAGLIRRCDAIAPQIDKLDASRRKVYGGRLRMCRGLYAYVLDSKKNSTTNARK